jgi:ribosomal protein S18 acetylase RimI-like enzyme
VRVSPDMIAIATASVDDAAEILALQKLAYQSEAQIYNDWSLPPLAQTLDSLIEEFAHTIILKATMADRIVGSVRARQEGDTCLIGRLVVHPEVQGQGIGSRLLRSIEARFGGAVRFELFTGSKSEANIRLYQRHGYTIAQTQPLSPIVSMVYLEKRAEQAAS